MSRRRLTSLSLALGNRFDASGLGEPPVRFHRHTFAARWSRLALFQMQRLVRSNTDSVATMQNAKAHASAILNEFEQAHGELVGKAVILTDGKAGTVGNVWLDEMHGLRVSIRGHDGKWPVSTIKFA